MANRAYVKKDHNGFSNMGLAVSLMQFWIERFIAPVSWVCGLFLYCASPIIAVILWADTSVCPYIVYFFV